MHSAVALRTTWICDSSPSPASLPDTVSVLSDRVTVNADLMKCGDPAHAAGAVNAATAKTSDTAATALRIRFPLRVQVQYDHACRGHCWTMEGQSYTTP